MNECASTIERISQAIKVVDSMWSDLGLQDYTDHNWISSSGINGENGIKMLAEKLSIVRWAASQCGKNVVFSIINDNPRRVSVCFEKR